MAKKLLIKPVLPVKTEEKPYESAHKLENIYLFFAIVNDGQGDAIAAIMNKHEAAGSYLCHGNGTAGSDFYHVMGFDVSKKQAVISIVKECEWPYLRKDLETRFAVSVYAKGIAFVIHIDSIVGVSAYKLVTNTRPTGLDKEVPMEEIVKNNDYEMIMTIVNDGYTDLVMEAAKKAGARGGTILHARGTGNKDIEKFFGVMITPEKQIVIVLVPKEIKDAVIAEIYKECGINTKGQGIAFAVPVSDVVGIVSPEALQEEEGKLEGAPDKQ